MDPIAYFLSTSGEHSPVFPYTTTYARPLLRRIIIPHPFYFVGFLIHQTYTVYTLTFSGLSFAICTILSTMPVILSFCPICHINVPPQHHYGWLRMLSCEFSTSLNKDINDVWYNPVSHTDFASYRPQLYLYRCFMCHLIHICFDKHAKEIELIIVVSGG